VFGIFITSIPCIPVKIYCAEMQFCLVSVGCVLLVGTVHTLNYSLAKSEHRKKVKYGKRVKASAVNLGK